LADADTKINFTATYTDKAGHSEFVTSPALNCIKTIQYTLTGAIDRITCS
jgi:hypothetical protein